MVTALFAVFVASLLGSFHCACMCGPIAIWSSGTQTTIARSERIVRIGGYHVGRLLTYLLLGFVAGLAGSAIGKVGEGAGFQSAAARVAGGTMILMGLWRLQSMWRGRSQNAADPGSHGGLSQKIAMLIAKVRPLLAKLPIAARSVGIGATTVLLPCGWLYLFVLFAAGSGSVTGSMSIMAAFWLGTIPSLVALVSGVFHLNSVSRRFLPRMAPVSGAVLLILFGAHTATGRASADLQSLERRMGEAIRGHDQDPSVTLEKMRAQPLPCCQTHE